MVVSASSQFFIVYANWGTYSTKRSPRYEHVKLVRAEYRCERTAVELVSLDAS